MIESLEDKIRRRIEQQGPISCREFMQMALYDPIGGYYSRRGDIGLHADYYTSSNIHPLFGQCLARKFASLLEKLDAGTRFAIVEVGAGTGQLAHDILTCLQEQYPRLASDLSYVISEWSPAFRRAENEKLRPFPNLLWKNLTEFEPSSVRGIIFSNELIDAMPVQRVIQRAGRCRELLVNWRHGEFCWTTGDLTSDALERVMSDSGIELQEGQIIEVNIGGIEYLQSVSSVLGEGYLVTIDYGDIRPRLYTPARPSGTLRCFYRHTINDHPFQRIGQQDITSSVDFTLLMEYGERVDLKTVEFKRQRQFLIDQGILDRLASLSREAQAGSAAQWKSLLAAKHFIMPGAMGDHFKILIQRKRAV